MGTTHWWNMRKTTVFPKGGEIRLKLVSQTSRWPFQNKYIKNESLRAGKGSPESWHIMTVHYILIVG